jgi:hypothetical protein
MNAKLVDSLAQIIQTLTDAERKELDTKLSTPARNTKITDRSTRFQQWDRLVSDADAAALLSSLYVQQLNEALIYTLKLDEPIGELE